MSDAWLVHGPVRAGLAQQSHPSSHTADHDDMMDTINHDFDNDTIYALSSGSSTLGQATAVAVVRLSGPMAADVLRSLTRRHTLPKPRYASLCTLYQPTTCETQFSQQDALPLDQALVLWFPGPNSFTGQDVVELHCHGSRAVVESVLQALSEYSASSSSSSQPLLRLAEPGEFTRRAWQSGKLSLLQVEALSDLLVADTRAQRVQALQLLRKDSPLRIYDQWRDQLVRGLAHAEAVIDFGDDEHLGNEEEEEQQHDHDDTLQSAQDSVWGSVQAQMQDLCRSMERHLYQEGRRGELVRNGVRIAIVGPPNAGKSSLLNILAQREVAIVSPLAGTTRDVVEVALNLGGVKCLVQDTAGLRRNTNDVIEQQGMERATRVAAEADMVLVMMDGSEAWSVAEDNQASPLEDADIDEMNWLLGSVLPDILSDKKDTETGAALTEKIPIPSLQASSQVMLIVNKSDLRSVPNGEALSMALGRSSADISNSVLNQLDQRFELSCVTQSGVDEFLEALTAKVVALVTKPSDSDVDPLVQDRDPGNLITRTRHRQHVQAAVDALHRFDDLSRQGTYAIDMAAEELRLAASELGRVTGAVDVEDVLDKLFADFCIGK